MKTNRLPGFRARIVLSLFLALFSFVGCQQAPATESDPDGSWNAAFRVSAGSLTAEQMASATWVRVEASRSGRVVASTEAAYDLGRLTLMIPTEGGVDITVLGFSGAEKTQLMWSGTGRIENGGTESVVTLVAGPGLTPTPPDQELLVTTFYMGSQEQLNLPSLLAVRKNGGIFIADLKMGASNIGDVDLILYEDVNTTTGRTDVNNARLWSPDAFAADATWGISTLVKTYFNATARATLTRFARLSGVDFTSIATTADFDAEIDGIAAADWKNNIDVVTGDVIAIKTTDGGYAIAKVAAATVVPNASMATTSDQLAVNLQIQVAVKK